MTEDKTGKMKSEVGGAKKGPPTLTIDWEFYGKLLDGSGLSEPEKRELLEALWSIVVSFVDLGFGVHPVQQVTGDNCENQAEIRKFIAAQSSSVVRSLEPSTTEFNAAADRQSGQSQERNPK